MRGAALILAAGLTLAAGACGGGENREAEYEQAVTYSRSVQRITDDVRDSQNEALMALNRLAETPEDPGRVDVRLARLARRVGSSREELRRLPAPFKARSSAGEHADAVGSLSQSLSLASTDVRTARDDRERRAVGLYQARVVLAYGSGISSLSRAVRALATESGGG